MFIEPSEKTKKSKSGADFYQFRKERTPNDLPTAPILNLDSSYSFISQGAFIWEPSVSSTQVLFLSHDICNVSHRLRNGCHGSEAAIRIAGRSCILSIPASSGAHPISLVKATIGVVLYTGRTTFAALFNTFCILPICHFLFLKVTQVSAPYKRAIRVVACAVCRAR